MSWLGIDLGTGSTKVVVVGADGRVIGHGTCAHPVRSPVAGAAESDPDDWLSSVAAATGDALADAGGPAIDAIGLSGQMHGVVCVDDDLQPLRPALLWADVRASAQCAAYRELSAGQRRALANPVVPGMFGPLLAWALDADPGLRQGVRWALSPKDWLRAALTGHVGTEPSDASATLLWDAPGGGWSTAACTALDLPLDVLPDVGPSVQVAGRLHRNGAALLGLADGVPVAAGAADVAAALVGSGVGVGQTQLSVGTGGQVVVPIDALTVGDDAPVTHRYRRADGHGWYAMAAVQNAGLALEWVRDVLRATWDEVHAALDRCGPGAGGVTFHGYLTGERTPVLDTDVRGAWAGLGLHTRRDALLRSALEGVAFALRDAADALAAEAVTVTDVRLVGGGSGDMRWRQLLADVLDRPLTVHPVEDASAVGAARLGAAAVGVELAADGGRVEHRVVPDARAAAQLDEVWRRWRSRRPGAS